uniref:R3H domain containing 1 n=1 Tax=Tetraodon nigroviridis TaxID=99883 RepID=H3CYD3_TETNG
MPSIRDNIATKSEVTDQNQSSKDEHGSNNNNKRDTQPVKYSKSNTRLKLVRSLAVCEESFPSPKPSTATPQSQPTHDVFPLQPFEKDDQPALDQSEKDDACEKVEQLEKTPRKMLSRDSSQDYTDSTGIDLHEFLVNTLKGNPRRDRTMLLKLEQEILDFISNNETQKRKFPPMTSYHRMLLHRVAAYFGMDHNVDPSGKSVVINKTTNTRIPDQKFSEHIKDDRADDFQKRYILKRDNSSFDREDSTIRMRLKADKRSKSMEEREEEYQRARERIFAHDSCSLGNTSFLSASSPRDEDACMSTKERRQMFRLRAGRSGASRQSSSETETLPRLGDPRPWSSTDSSDSSNRLALRPAITKASSFSSISPCLVRGDSTASSKSTGRLSKTGSESCSSVGSSSSSLSRPQLPLPVSGSSWSNISSVPLIHPAADTRGSAPPEMIKSVPSQTPSAADTANYFVLPLDASGIPAGSVLVSPHTGKPFIHPDGSAVVYGPTTVSSAAARNPQQGKNPQQPIPALTQQQPSAHFHSQPDALNTQFSHMTLGQQQPSGGLFGGRATRRTPRCAAGPAHHTPDPCSTPGPAAFQGTTINQQLLQQHAYIQQPVQQMSACYCTSAHHPHCSSGLPSTLRPIINSLSYNCPQNQNLAQHQVHQAVMPNPGSSYQTVVGVQPGPNLTLTGNQQSNMGNQMQGMMVQYPPVQSYQQVSVPQQPYQQPVLVSCQPGQGAVAVAGVQPCYGLLPPNQHTTMSSTVSFLPAQMMEFAQPMAPCVPHQHPSQQYAGLLPPSSSSGMVMLQMTASPCQQARAPSPSQRKQPHHKQPGSDPQRPRRSAEFPPPSDNTQLSDSDSSLPLSPALTPLPGQPPSIKGLPPGFSSIPIMAHHHHHFAFSQIGEAHYSLLGQPLQYKPSIRPQLIHTAHMVAKHQGPLGVWRSGQGRKASRKPLSSEFSVGESGIWK